MTQATQAKKNIGGSRAGAGRAKDAPDGVIRVNTTLTPEAAAFFLELGGGKNVSRGIREAARILSNRQQQQAVRLLTEQGISATVPRLDGK